jgi:arylsulfatase A-like enzyme
MWKRFLAIVLFGLLVISGCAPVDDQLPEPARSVLLITVDALRADAVSWTGRDGFQTTPNLDALAGSSVVFTQAVTSFPGTTASMPSLMTGLYPSFEGVEEWNEFTYHGFNEFETEEEAGRPVIGDALPMLAEILADSGFRTIGFNTNPNLIADRNFNQGFTDYDDFGGYISKAKKDRKHRLEAAYPPADVVMSRVIPTVESLGEEPFFMWIHLMEPHSPYLPPPPYDRVSTRVFSPVPDLEINGVLYNFLHRQWGAKPEKIVHPSLDEVGIDKAQLIEHLWGLYEGEIRFGDAEIGRLLAVMDERGLLDDTLIVITADHGEEFFDHGYVTHHRSSGFAEELIRIPLLVRPPGGLAEPETVHGLVRMVDLAPTILDFLGLEEGNGSMEGRTLRPLVEGETDGPRIAFYSTIRYEIVRTERWKYRLEKETLVDGRPVERLFDIVADPMETTDLAAEHPEVIASLRAEYAAFAEGLGRRGSLVAQGAAAAGTPDAIDEETRDQLEALGYLD